MEVRTIAISGAIRAPLVALTAAQARIAQPTKHWSVHLSHWELHRKAECHDSSVQHGHCRRRWLSAEQSIPAVEGSEQQQEEREERAHAECGEGTHRAGSPDIGCGVPGQCADDHQRGAAQPIPALPVPHGIVHTSRDEPAARRTAPDLHMGVPSLRSPRHSAYSPCRSKYEEACLKLGTLRANLCKGKGVQSIAARSAACWPSTRHQGKPTFRRSVPGQAGRFSVLFCLPGAARVLASLSRKVAPRAKLCKQKITAPSTYLHESTAHASASTDDVRPQG
jgi:hypothetical protein